MGAFMHGTAPALYTHGTAPVLCTHVTRTPRASLLPPRPRCTAQVNSHEGVPMEMMREMSILMSIRHPNIVAVREARSFD